MKPTATVNVDLCNPGQVFACCGLFELAYRLTQKVDEPAMAWFVESENPQTQFHIAAHNLDGPLSLQHIISELKMCKIDTRRSGKEGPIFLGQPFEITLDWRSPFPQNKLAKTWAGGQSLATILPALVDALYTNVDNKILSCTALIKGKATGFDVSRSEGALDAGFAMDDMKQYTSLPCIFLELLAVIGLQRFCPQPGLERLDRLYTVWCRPLSICAAQVALSQIEQPVVGSTFSYTMFLRDSEGRYKSFNHSRVTTTK